MTDARIRRFDAVLVWKLGRWGRSVADCVRTVQELASLGVRFVATTQNIDTDEMNPASLPLLHLFAAFTEFEREFILRTVISGVRNARINGKSISRRRRVLRRFRHWQPARRPGGVD